MSDKTILVVGTFDTKDDELNFLTGVICDQGGHVVTMDVSVLGDPSNPTDYSKHDVGETFFYNSLESEILTKSSFKPIRETHSISERKSKTWILRVLQPLLLAFQAFWRSWRSWRS